jgi:hypothetical protein
VWKATLWASTSTEKGTDVETLRNELGDDWDTHRAVSFGTPENHRNQVRRDVDPCLAVEANRCLSASS